jgi:uncharacterized repeat protein (TIGR01451 family)
MRKAIIGAALVVLFCGAASVGAQDTASGRAIGSTLETGGTTVVTQSDTGPQTAPNPTNTPNANGFDKTVPGSFVPLAPLANVVTGPSTTRGCAVPNGCPELFSTPGPTPLAATLSDEVFAQSDAGSATAAVLPSAAPGGADVLDTVSSGSTVTVRCNNDTPGQVTPQFTANSEVNALVIGGMPVPVPGQVGPNTQLVSSQASLLVLNEQTDCGTTATSASCTVTALHFQSVPPSGGASPMDLKLSTSTAAITFDPATCPCNVPLLNVTKMGNVLGEPTQVPHPGDTIEYTLTVTNTGCVTATGVMLIDHLPFGVTVDQATLPPDGHMISCPADTPPTASGCGSDGCLSFNQIGTNDTLATKQTDTRVFRVIVGANEGCNANGVGFPICNLAFANATNSQVASQSASSVAICPNGPPGGGTPPPGTPAPTATPGTGATATPGGPGTGTPTPGGPGNDTLVTTGGGCSLGGGSAPIGALPVVSVGLLLAVRQWRRRASRAR